MWKIYVIQALNCPDVLYVGITSKLIEERYEEHATLGHSRISKYIIENGGASQFTMKELHSGDTYWEGLEWERHFILELVPPFNTQHYWTEEIEAARKLRTKKYFIQRALRSRR